MATEYYVRPTLKSGMSFNGHIVVNSERDDPSHVSYLELFNSNRTDNSHSSCDDTLISIQLEPAMFIEFEERCGLTGVTGAGQPGFMRIPRK